MYVNPHSCISLRYPSCKPQAETYGNDHIVHLCMSVCVCNNLGKLQTMAARTSYWQTLNYPRTDVLLKHFSL